MARRATQIEKILGAMAMGCRTSPQISEHTGLDISSVTTRLNVCFQRGLVDRYPTLVANKGSRPVIVWRIVEKRVEPMITVEEMIPIWNLRHTSLTGELLGDPLPGRSALDRMARK